MEKVYRNSYCNIAAADAEDSTGGLFRPRDPYGVMLSRLETTSGSLLFGRHRWRVLRADMWDNGLLRMPLYKRGWVYQGHMHPTMRFDILTYNRTYACSQNHTLQSKPDFLGLYRNERL